MSKVNTVKLEERLLAAQKISGLLREGDFVSAMVGVETLPADFPKDPFYAGIALAISTRKVSEGFNEVAEALLKYATAQCKYLGK